MDDSRLTPQTIVFATNTLRFEEQDWALFHNDQRVNIPAQEFKLLCLLLRSANRVVGRKTIEKELWPDYCPSSNATDKLVSNLRKLLREFPEGPQIITERGRGFRLEDETAVHINNSMVCVSLPVKDSFLLHLASLNSEDSRAFLRRTGMTQEELIRLRGMETGQATIPSSLLEAICYRIDKSPMLEIDFLRLEADDIKAVAEVRRLGHCFPTGTSTVLLGTSKRELALFDNVQSCKVHLSLPNTGKYCFGRTTAMKDLSSAWEDSRELNILVLWNWGGTGKTTVVNRWINQIIQQNLRQPEIVFGYSFHSPGSSGQLLSADTFLHEALRFLEEQPSQGMSIEKAQQLAYAIRNRDSIFILDGVDPFQTSPGPNEGTLRDMALLTFFKELAINNKGLCIVTTRLPLTDLIVHEGMTVKQIELPPPEIEDAVKIIRAHIEEEHVLSGEDLDQLCNIAKFLHRHPLSLTLAGTYIRDICGGNPSLFSSSHLIEEDESREGRANFMIYLYEQWFGDGEHLSLLRLLSVFTQSPSLADLQLVCQGPPLNGVTDRLHLLTENKWVRMLADLRRARLLSSPVKKGGPCLEIHPLVREYFSCSIKVADRTVWTELHSRLFDLRCAQAHEFARNLHEMEPLYSAVYHGIMAGRQEEAYLEVYERRIQQGKKHFSTTTLGTVGADLVALRSFFEVPWNKVIPEIDIIRHAELLFQAGFLLRANGQFESAADALKASIEAFVEDFRWKEASKASSNMSQTCLELGRFEEAEFHARQAVKFGNQSGDLRRQVISHAYLGTVLHYRGIRVEAFESYRTAEKLYQNPLDSFEGIRFCELLIDEGEFTEAATRLTKNLKLAKRTCYKLDIAEHKLVLARALAESNAEDVSQIEHLIKSGVDTLLNAGHRDHLPFGLVLAATTARKVLSNLQLAGDYVQQALSIADRLTMLPAKADALLEVVEIKLASADNNREHDTFDELEEAQCIIDNIGYFRKSETVVRLRDQVNEKHAT